MEQNFQTSFIPKKPIVQEEVSTSKKPMSFLTVFGIIVFLTMVATYGGLFLYQTTLAQKIESSKQDLQKAGERFEIAKINELQNLNKRLNAANKILEKHITISPIFEILQNITMKSVRYNKFTYSISDKNEIIVSLSGEAEGYRSIALQSDLFSQEKNLIQPVFSNLTLNDKGAVLFDLEFKVDPILVNYKQSIDAQRVIPPNQNNITPLEDINIVN